MDTRSGSFVCFMEDQHKLSFVNQETQMSCFDLSTGTLFTQVPTNFCMNKNLHGSILHLNGTSGTGQIFERLTVQVWDLKKEGPKNDSNCDLYLPI